MNHANHQGDPKPSYWLLKIGVSTMSYIIPFNGKATKKYPQIHQPNFGAIFCISSVNILQPCTWDPLSAWSHPMRHRLRGKTSFPPWSGGTLQCTATTKNTKYKRLKKRTYSNCFMLTYCYQAGHLDSSNPPAPGSLWVVSIQRSSPLTARTVQASSKPRPDGGEKKNIWFTSTWRSFLSCVILIIIVLDVVSTQTDVWCVDANLLFKLRISISLEPENDTIGKVKLESSFVAIFHFRLKKRPKKKYEKMDGSC